MKHQFSMEVASMDIYKIGANQNSFTSAYDATQ